MGSILEEGLLPLCLIFNIPSKPETQQAHDGGNCKQHRKKYPVQHYDIARDRSDVYVHDVGVWVFCIAVVLLHGQENQVVIARLEGIALAKGKVPSAVICQQLRLQPVGFPTPAAWLVAVLQFQKDNAGCKKVLLLRIVPIVVRQRSAAGIGDGAVLVLRFIAQRLFRFARKVGRDDDIDRQHEQRKEQQRRAEDQIHNSLLDVLHTLSASFSL